MTLVKMEGVEIEWRLVSILELSTKIRASMRVLESCQSIVEKPSGRSMLYSDVRIVKSSSPEKRFCYLHSDAERD